jgi:hypothetical protein
MRLMTQHSSGEFAAAVARADCRFDRAILSHPLISMRQNTVVVDDRQPTLSNGNSAPAADASDEAVGSSADESPESADGDLSDHQAGVESYADRDETDQYERQPKGSLLANSAPKPRKLDIMERFARSQGYKKDGEDRYFHGNGDWIGRARFTLSMGKPECLRGIERYYWPKDHCLEREPLQLEADMWALIDQHPGSYALVLSDLEGSAVEVTGARQRAMREQGGLTLYPATYRIVFNDHRT